MLKGELEERIEEKVTDEQYRVFCRVYENYPGIKDKDQMIALLDMGGWHVIYDMYPRANYIRLLKERARELDCEREKTREELEAVKEPDYPCY